jgi:hypothetical protein
VADVVREVRGDVKAAKLAVRLVADRQQRCLVEGEPGERPAPFVSAAAAGELRVQQVDLRRVGLGRARRQRWRCARAFASGESQQSPHGCRRRLAIPGCKREKENTLP